MTDYTLNHVQLQAQRSLVYLDSGDRSKPCLVVLHSLGADHRMWAEHLPVLARQFRVIAPDTRGHGNSDLGATQSVQDWVADLDVVLDHAGAQQVILVGISLGGIQAIAYTACHLERVAALVVADSFVALPPEVASAKIRQLSTQAWSVSMSDVADQYISDTFAAPIPAGANTVREAIAHMDAEDYVAAVTACFSVQIADQLATITVPTLVLWGDHDHKTPRELSERITAGIGDAVLCEVPAAGHLSSVDNPSAFLDLVTSFLRERLTVSSERQELTWAVPTRSS